MVHNTYEKARKTRGGGRICACQKEDSNGTKEEQKMHNIIYNTKNEILWFSIPFVNSEEGDGHILLFNSQMHILSQNFQNSISALHSCHVVFKIYIPIWFFPFISFLHNNLLYFHLIMKRIDKLGKQRTSIFCTWVRSYFSVPIKTAK